RSDPSGVTLQTAAGEIRARRAVFAAGPWLNPLLASEQVSRPLRLKIEVERQTTHWFGPAPGVTGLRAAVCPITMLERTDGRMLYTLPDVGHGVKAALHHGGDVVSADTVDRTISMAEEERLRAMLDEWMPGAAHRVLDGEVCLYTNTPDRHFILDAHPSHGNVLLVSACSGHGFKFATSLAEIVADLTLEGAAAYDVSLFTVSRVIDRAPLPTDTERRTGRS
ncbi:MAG: FAD-dependent oxidoreductase, partial [Longimicrobiales bacterium]